jgi:tRNA U34 5-methylaminomethyl-2-thiouridine-forming methyltransferase MnmC
LKLLTTSDGSQTILNEALGSTYHSRHGALTESEHVFIHAGLRRKLTAEPNSISILEMGFGTGLNALLTYRAGTKANIPIHYEALELFPVPKEVWQHYMLPSELNALREVFENMHHAVWNDSVMLTNAFALTKHHVSLLNFHPNIRFDLVYYDAFEPETQPELWTKEVFERLFSWLNPGGILTTYCCKGDVRRAMLAAGFLVEKLPGPPRKREMIRATRPL